MQYSPNIPSPSSPQSTRRPFLVSFDSGHECSLDHWVELSWLVEHEEDEELTGYLVEDSCFVVTK
jgi:hypothetical protein